MVLVLRKVVGIYQRTQRYWDWKRTHHPNICTPMISACEILTPGSFLFHESQSLSRWLGKDMPTPRASPRPRVPTARMPSVVTPGSQGLGRAASAPVFPSSSPCLGRRLGLVTTEDSSRNGVPFNCSDFLPPLVLIVSRKKKEGKGMVHIYLYIYRHISIYL